MPKITDERVLAILQNTFFDQHTAMHLARLRLDLPDGTKLPLILPPCLCDNCADDAKPDNAKGAAPTKAAMGGMAGMGGADSSGGMADGGDPMGMIEAGQPGSGKQLIEMHHDMIRVFRFLLENNGPPLKLQIEWRDGEWRRPTGNGAGYAPQIWSLDGPDGLPHEISGMLSFTDPKYLGLVYEGVKRLVNAQVGTVDDAVDALGRFIEQGVPGGHVPDGSGFHNTMHEYLAAREGLAAKGAEMNKLTNSRFNDYFWGLHFWMEGQYLRLLEYRKQPVDISPLDPATLDMCTSDMGAANGKMPAMTMSMSKEAP